MYFRSFNRLECSREICPPLLLVAIPPTWERTAAPTRRIWLGPWTRTHRAQRRACSPGRTLWSSAGRRAAAVRFRPLQAVVAAAAVTFAPPPGRLLRAANGVPWWASRARVTRRRRKTRPLWCLGPLQRRKIKYNYDY